ncbi:MAG: hypothetical protein DI581_12215, partial [Staphylococcus capitis]
MLHELAGLGEDEQVPDQGHRGEADDGEQAAEQALPAAPAPSGDPPAARGEPGQPGLVGGGGVDVPVPDGRRP